jgi:hypothetical protein
MVFVPTQAIARLLPCAKVEPANALMAFAPTPMRRRPPSVRRADTLTTKLPLGAMPALAPTARPTRAKHLRRVASRLESHARRRPRLASGSVQTPIRSACSLPDLLVCATRLEIVWLARVRPSPAAHRLVASTPSTSRLALTSSSLMVRIAVEVIVVAARAVRARASTTSAVDEGCIWQPNTNIWLVSSFVH